jgi:type IX secretion system substrate protein
MRKSLLQKLTTGFIALVLVLIALPSGSQAVAKNDSQLTAGDYLQPKAGEVLKVYRPYAPQVNFTNTGAADASKINFRMVVKNSEGVEVYNNVATLDLIEGNTTKVVTFPKLVITSSGEYTTSAWVETSEYERRASQTATSTIEVERGLAGTFVIGSADEIDGKNNKTQTTFTKFPTVDSLMNTLYREGISADVEFRFTDAEYILNAPNALAPAWDMSARIIGVGPTNDPNDADGVYRISMRPANNRIAVRGGVKFKMTAASGIGIRFGHELQPSNQNAVIINFPEREYARSAGYITFDGGSQKCFEFELNTSNTLFGAAVYLQRGSSNITIKNCLITNNAPQIKNSVSIPTAKFGENNGFTYDRDVFRSQGGQDISYSAGIISRSTLIEATTFIGDLRDTLENFNNSFVGNDISNFGIGIIDIGLGVLRHDYSSDPNILDTLKSFYNYNNVITDNRIWGAARTGIFVGYTQDQMIERNLIWNVSAPAGTMASGIEAGGNFASNSKGYHNLRLSILGNRITNLSSNTNVTGIRVEQDRTIYETGENPIIFPRTNERARIANNFIWGLNISNGSASRAGIHLLTERAGSLVTPDVLSYVSRFDDIINNTILIGATGVANTGMTVGIGIQNTRSTNVVNNAISIVDPNVGPNSQIAASILVQGNFTNDLLNVDRNVYWTGQDISNLDATNLDILRYIEQDEDKAIVSMGYRLEYANLNQIQAATNTQNNSLYGNFLVDHELYQRSGIEPLLYRVKSNPAPLNSVLNNRGQNITWLKTDFEGDVRGAAGQRYDIGADEFIGRLHVFDIAPVTLLSPRSYRDITTQFSDAEYIMGEAPFEVTANVRNNGSIQQAGTKVFVKIYREDENGLFSGAPVLEKDVLVTIPATDNVVFNFGLADGLDGDDWNPMSYDDLINAQITVNIPAKFAEMSANVTPRYKIDILVGSDLENINNLYSKNVRFYLKKTNRHIIVSSVNTTADPLAGVANATAGKLNYEAIKKGFDSIGFKVESVSNEPVYDYDIFDRGSWEPRAVNYKLYNFMFYSEAYNVLPTRWEKMDLYTYLNTGTERLKNNLVVSTEEWSKLNTDEDFQNIVLRANYVNSNPLGTGASYEGNTIIGETISKDFVIPITRPTYSLNNVPTFYPNDPLPFPAVVTTRNYGSDTKPLVGLSYPAYLFNLASPLNGKVFGTTNITVTYNIIHNTVDWRHFGDIETVIRGTIDHLERNDASIVPVELADFNAIQNKKSVVLDWSTASENGTSRFIVERADATDNVVTGNFVSTGIEVSAVGKSTEMNYYSPVVDNKVEYGNTYAYRLRTIDFDGSSEAINQVRIVEIKPEGNFNFAGITQNPASTTTDLLFENGNTSPLTLEVVDINGNVLLTETLNGSKYSLNVSNLVSGTYTLVLRSESGIQTRQLSVVR